MKKSVTIIAALIVLLLSAPSRGLADDASDAKNLIDQAEITLKNFMNDPDMKWFASHLQEAKGVFIVPKLTKGAFIFGVEGGNGVVLARDEKPVHGANRCFMKPRQPVSASRQEPSPQRRSC